MDLSHLPRDKNGFIIPTDKYCKLYTKTNYLTKEPYVAAYIYEYDIQAANVTMLEQSGKISPEAIAELRSMEKLPRERTIGKMIRADKNVYHIIRHGILRARETLFRMNHIQEHEVIGIKNDAVFITGRKLEHTQFRNVNFRMKNQYNLFYQMNRMEFYYDGRTRKLDIKGISDNVISEPDHQNGMMIFLSTVFRYISMGRMDDLRKYLITFVNDYKRKQLPHEYYREFSSDNIYRTIMELSGFSYNLISATDSDLEMITGVYNYNRFILPIVQQFI